ncbi:DUF502 domain-containing protein [Halorhodospira neutriphila]|uniref:DUF502 domain-containing protein n=1 Tax=Halorhodospira neutriphila TaxID=168379 RepID=A0ABS1E201_9GAMM|nr:DUF502 domain-containing protein [Halorhodospira neutriphila]MBK1725811.1 hypothetical protein [Halorhodospira neutriphila]
MRRLGTLFLKGLLAVLPAAVTLYLLYWLLTTAERLLGSLVRVVLPDAWYLPGMGVALAVSGILAVGTLLNFYVLRRVWEWGERLMLRLPVARTVYGAVQDLTEFVSRAEELGDQVVTVPLPGSDYRLLGVVTRREWQGVAKGLGGEETIAVYTPMSYQVGGYTLLVPASAVEPVEMSVEDAMRFAVTAGMSTYKRSSPLEDSRSDSDAAEG